MANRKDIRNAAQWPLDNPPGTTSLLACKSRLGLTAKEMASVCVRAAQIRSQHFKEAAESGRAGIQ